MIASRALLRMKNAVKSTWLGKKLRDKYERRGFTRKNAEKTFDKFRSNGWISPELKKEETVNDMLREARDYSFDFDEYFMYHFYDKSGDVRRTFVSERERISYCERMNSMKNMIIFDDKALTYQYFGKYYYRDLIEIFSGNKKSFQIFDEFTEKHSSFIVKPFDGSCGYGIRIIKDVEEKRKCFDTLIREYKRGFVIEELIKQAEEVSALHPQSVNTLRLSTINYGDHIEIIHPALRVGVGDAVIDNAGAGGLCCSVNEKGIVYSVVDESGCPYITHPDTGITLVGFEIPKWQEAKNLALEMANILPDNRYTGWDLALTDAGWILQEANDRGAFVPFQLTEPQGCRSEIEAIAKALGV